MTNASRLANVPTSKATQPTLDTRVERHDNYTTAAQEDDTHTVLDSNDNETTQTHSQMSEESNSFTPLDSKRVKEETTPALAVASHARAGHHQHWGRHPKNSPSLSLLQSYVLQRCT
jgi:hypothetical protein